MDGHIPSHATEQLGGLALVGGEGDANVAVAGDGFLATIDAVELGEVLGDEESADAVAGEISEGFLKEGETAESGEFVEHEEEGVAVVGDGAAFGEVEGFGEASQPLVEQHAHERAGAVEIGGGHGEVEAQGALVIHEVEQAEIGGGGVAGDEGVAVEVKEGEGGGDHAAALAVGLVEQGAGGAGDYWVGTGGLAGEGIGPAAGSVLIVGAVEHLFESLLERTLGVAEQVHTTAQGLVGFGIEDVEEHPNQEGMGGAVPMVSPSVAVGVDEDVGDDLGVPYFIGTEPDLFEGVVAGGAFLGGGVEAQAEAAELSCAPARGEGPVLAFDVVHEHRMGPSEQVGHHQAYALARPGGSEDEDMLRTVVPEEVTTRTVGPLSQEQACGAEEAGLSDVLGGGPMGGAVGVGQGMVGRFKGDGEDD